MAAGEKGRLVRDSVARNAGVSVDDLTDSDTLYESLGLDSLDRANIAVEIEEECSVDRDVLDDLWTGMTVAEVVAKVEATA